LTAPSVSEAAKSARHGEIGMLPGGSVRFYEATAMTNEEH